MKPPVKSSRKKGHSSKNSKSEFIEKVVADIVSKYKNNTGLAETPQMQRQEKKVMIQEIKMLA